MTRIPLLPENDVAERVKAVLAEIDALKTAQALGGDSIQRYYIASGNAWDINNLSIPAGVHTYVWRVTLNSDHPDLQPFSEFEAFWQWVGAKGTNQLFTWTDDATGLPYDGNRQILVFFYNLSGEATSIDLRFTFNSSDSGNLTWEQIA